MVGIARSAKVSPRGRKKKKEKRKKEKEGEGGSSCAMVHILQQYPPVVQA